MLYIDNMPMNEGRMPLPGVKTLLTTLCLCLLFTFSAHAKESQDLMAALDSDFLQAFGSEDFVSIATGRPQRLVEAPAVTSVITRDDIRAMGATELREVLEMVPGLHTSVSATANSSSTYLMRGIYHQYNPHVLVLVNGVPQTSLLFGNRGQAWSGLPLANVERIEIIRGPGSAIYGADAFAGVINILTHRPSTAFDSGIKYGSFNTTQAWAQYSGLFAGWNYSSSLQLRQTDGHREPIISDAQTIFDNAFGTSASLAPGATNNQSKWIDASLELEADSFITRGQMRLRRDIGTGQGIAEALDPAGSSDSDYFGVDLKYSKPEIQPDLDLNWTAGVQYLSSRLDLTLYPPGAFNDAYPDGFIGQPSYWERHFRSELSAFYRGMNFHTWRLGAGVHLGDQYRVEEHKNFAADGSPLGSLIDVTDTSDVYTPEADRLLTYTYAQDEWLVAPDWILTGGLRFDHYSDFGSTLNPRLAIVWNARAHSSFKLLYGRAYRSPSFAELHNKNNPLTLGNRQLKPETIDTTEFAYDFHPTPSLQSKVNVFYYKTKDMIQFVQDPSPATSSTAQNLGEATGYGLEWEIDWSPINKLDLKAHYALQQANDNATDNAIGYAPTHQVFTSAHWRLNHQIGASAWLKLISERKRGAGDTRADIGDDLLNTIHIYWQTLKHNWEMSLTANNFLDLDIREPSYSTGNIPNDIPQAGRNITVGIRFNHD